MAMANIWLFLVRSVFVFQAYFGLLCLGYLVAAFSFGGSRALVTRAAISIEINCVTEVLWYLVWFLPYRARRQRPGYRPTALRKGQRVELFRKVLEHVPDPEQFVRRWAKNAHMEDIRRENLKEWLLWVLFDQEGPPGAANVELEDYVTEMEEKLEARIKPGRGDAEMMRPSLDVVVMNHRSLLYYQVVGTLDLITSITLFVWGFSYYRQPRKTFFRSFPPRISTLLAPDASAAPQLSYFYRPHKCKMRRPIVFLHGIGIGLFPYLLWLRSLPVDVGVVLIELLPASGHLTKKAPSPADLALCVAKILDQQAPHFDKDFVLMADGYGSLLVAPLLSRTDLAAKISRVVLVDPLALLLHLPDALHNTSSPMRPPQDVASFLAHQFARDPAVAPALRRQLAWHECALWREELQSDTAGRRTTIFVSSRDCVVDARALASYAYYGDCSYDAAVDMDEWRATPARWTGRQEVELVWLEGVRRGTVFWRRRGKGDGSGAFARVVDRYCSRRPIALKEEDVDDGFISVKYSEVELAPMPGLPKPVVPRGMI